MEILVQLKYLKSKNLNRKATEDRRWSKLNWVHGHRFEIKERKKLRKMNNFINEYFWMTMKQVWFQRQNVQKFSKISKKITIFKGYVFDIDGQIEDSPIRDLFTLKLAANVQNREFIAHPNCQHQLQQTWLKESEPILFLRWALWYHLVVRNERYLVR